MSRYRHVVVAGRYVLRSLFRRGGTWATNVRDLETGRVFRRSASPGRTRTEAELEIQEYLERLARRKVAGDPPTIDAAWAEWYELRSARIREPTRRTYHWLWESRLKPHLGGKRIDQVQLAHVERYIAMRQKAGRRPSTIALEVGILRSFFRWARRREYVDRDPTEAVELCRKTRPVGRALSEDEAQRLLAACLAPEIVQIPLSRDGRRPWQQQRPAPGPYLLGAAIALYTGLRLRNVVELTWRHVDFDHGRIDLADVEWKGKRPHSVPLHPTLRRLLEEELRRRGTIDPTARILQGRPRVRSTRDALRKSIGRAARIAQLGHVRFHDLRHTYATWLESRCTYAVLQRLLGHAISSVTGIYLHPTWEALVAAIERLPDLTIGLGVEGSGGTTGKKVTKGA